MGVQELDVKQLVGDAMMAFRSRLLRYEVESGHRPPLPEVESAVKDVLRKLLPMVIHPAWDPEKIPLWHHFDVEARYLTANDSLVAIDIDSKSEYGRELLEVMADLGASFN